MRSSASRGIGSVEKRRTIRRLFRISANSKRLAGDAETEVERLDRLGQLADRDGDRKSTRLNSSHSQTAFAGFRLKKNAYALAGVDYISVSQLTQSEIVR